MRRSAVASRCWRAIAVAALAQRAAAAPAAAAPPASRAARPDAGLPTEQQAETLDYRPRTDASG